MAASVYALVGSDPYLQTQNLAQIIQSLPRDVQRLDVDGTQAPLADVLDELRSFAMFSTAKLVVVRDADEFISRFREPLEQFLLAGPPAGSVLVLRVISLPANQRIAKAIAKVGRIEKCDPPRDLARWILQQSRTIHKLDLAADAADLLADRIGADLGRIDNELAKLAIVMGETKITAAQLAQTVAFQREQEMWDMTNALAAGRNSEALRRWRRLVQMDPSAEFRAVTWLGMWLENVSKALKMKRAGVPPHTIASQLRIWPTEQQGPFFRTAEALGETGVARAVALLARIDFQSKTGVGDAAQNVERFLLALAASPA